MRPWRRWSASASIRCSGSGAGTDFSHIASTNSSSPRTPKFVDNLSDIVSLYVDPPAHVFVLSVDEKSQIQALDHTQPGLPMEKGRAGTVTHDYKRHGTTTLLAAVNVLDGTVIGRNMQRHRHQEFVHFLNAVEREVPAGKTVHASLDNCAAHKYADVRPWLARHPRWDLLGLVDGALHLRHRAYDLVLQGEDAERPPSAVSLRDVRPANRQPQSSRRLSASLPS